MSDPWTFGWTQALTIMGFVITIAIAVGGFRSFDRWRREQLEAKRIDTALEALTIAYKTKFVFEHVRSVMASGYEWKDMPTLPDDSDDKRQRRGAFYAVFKRIEHNKEYFDALWQLQPKFMAMFGARTETTFLKVHQARRNIEVAAQMLYEQALNSERYERDDSTRKLWAELRGDLWAPMASLTESKIDRVGKLLDEFRTEIEAICLPLLVAYQRKVPQQQA
jgi:hypothetical protein